MRLPTLLSTTSVCRFIGVPRKTLDQWIKAELVRPAIFGRGRGHHHLFAVPEVLAIAVGRAFRVGGLSLRRCGLIMEWIQGRTVEQLESDFAAGRTLLVQIADLPPLPDLRSRDDLERFGQIPRDSLVTLIVDLSAPYRALVYQLAAEEEAQTAEPVEA